MFFASGEESTLIPDGARQNQTVLEHFGQYSPVSIHNQL